MIIQSLTLIVLCLTFFAIVWYSWETRELRKWQKRQAQLSVIHMEMNYLISVHASGPERSPGVLLNKWEMAQREIIQGQDISMRDLFDPNKR